MSNPEQERMRKRALDKIRKCLALGASSNAHEAEAALRQARKLMDKYQLEQSDVLASSIESHSFKVSKSSRMPQLWVRLLSETVAGAFGCIKITNHSPLYGCAVVFIGPVGAGEMAGYAYEVLSRQLDLAKKAFQEALPNKGRGYKRRMGARYAEQWIRSVSRKVRSFSGADEGATKAMDAYMAKHYPNLQYVKPPKRKLDADEMIAALAGHEDGLKASLHVPMGADAPLAGIEVGNTPSQRPEQV